MRRIRSDRRIYHLEKDEGRKWMSILLFCSTHFSFVIVPIRSCGQKVTFLRECASQIVNKQKLTLAKFVWMINFNPAWAWEKLSIAGSPCNIIFRRHITVAVKENSFTPTVDSLKKNYIGLWRNLKFSVCICIDKRIFFINVSVTIDKKSCIQFIDVCWSSNKFLSSNMPRAFSNFKLHKCNVWKKIQASP